MALVDPGKLSAEVQRVLQSAGWTRERKVDVVNLLSVLEESGFHPHPLAREVLESFGGLVVDPVNRVGPDFRNDEPFTFKPIDAAGHLSDLQDVEEALGGRYFPLGEWMTYSNVFLEAGGRMVASDGVAIWELGGSFESGLEFALRAHHPLVVLRAG
jgi:hypothetical protein